MALTRTRIPHLLSVCLPTLFGPTIARPMRFKTSYACQLFHPLVPSLTIAFPSITLNVPGILEGIWESVLRAVPKKKTSHMKKRHRQMAGKALKDVTELNKCSGCGAVKRAHVLCRSCVAQIQSMFRDGKSEKKMTSDTPTDGA